MPAEGNGTAHLAKTHLAKTLTVAFIGTEARLVEVEVHVGTGLPTFKIVGLPTKSVQEAEQRVRSALVSSSQRWPTARIVANLAPGALRKEGTHFDLPLALGIVAGDGRLDAGLLDGWLALGELALDGSVRRVRGVLPAAIACRELDLKGLVCPAANAAEAAVVSGIEVVPVQSLSQCIAWLKGDWLPPQMDACDPPDPAPREDLLDVRGNSPAKRALEIAAAGGHNLLLDGPPGAGKTMLARRLPGILPEMSAEESMDVTRIHSIAGLLGDRAALVSRRPFRMPHHSISIAGLVGGGPGFARPGEISLAHHGLDECY